MVQKLVSEDLTGLRSDEQLRLLDAIDSLRLQGIDRYISLPQIIVCGDQSSGKSSVLEAISGVSFPIKSNLCTRFPTEIVLRKTAQPSVNVSIAPHHSRGEDDKDSLSRFRQDLDSFEGLPALIENAKDAMGISEYGKTFSRDRLRVEISGPDRPHLTIVDLPGLIHSENKYQTAEDVGLIKTMVMEYMKEPRSIILAVVSAKNDYANQIVLKLARDADRRGRRTMGVITKPDTLVRGSGSEDAFIALAKNQDIHFRLGWHVLCNLDSDVDQQPSLAERNRREEDFFLQGPWAADHAQLSLGIDRLRLHLSEVLTVQIAAELPGLIDEIDVQIASCQRRMDQLGKPRSTMAEHRYYLIDMSQSFQSLARAAVDGTYDEEAFFGDAMTSEGEAKRMRAVVQNLNDGFAAAMETDGRQRRTDGTSRNDFISDIKARMVRTRGRELPGMFNHMIVADLFREQSSPWGGIVKGSLGGIRRATEAFLQHVVAHIADESSRAAILESVVEPRLEEILAAVGDETDKLLTHIRKVHPTTFNKNFLQVLRDIRLKRHKPKGVDSVRKHLQDSFRGNGDANKLYDMVLAQVENDSNTSAASDALDYLEAYYEIALERFIDDFAVQVVETKLVALLPGIMSPLAVSVMPDDEVARIAEESEESKATRHGLGAKLEILRNGARTCKGFVKFRQVDVGSEDEPQPVNSAADDEDSLCPVEIPTPEREPEPEANPQPEPECSIDDIWGSTMKKGKKKAKQPEFWG